MPLDATYAALAAGEAALVATDTVIGLAALPGSPGVQRIFQLKQRPEGQALPWLVCDAQALSRYGADVAPQAHELACRYWPGALTLVVNASEEALALGDVAANRTLALRCPAAPQLIELMRHLGSPLACTSANLHGQPAACDLRELPEEFRELAGYEELPTSLRTAACVSLASTIIDTTTRPFTVLREGPIKIDVQSL